MESFEREAHHRPTELSPEARKRAEAVSAYGDYGAARSRELAPHITNAAALEVELETATAALAAAKRAASKSSEIVRLENELRALRGDTGTTIAPPADTVSAAQARYDYVAERLRAARDTIAVRDAELRAQFGLS